MSDKKGPAMKEPIVNPIYGRVGIRHRDRRGYAKEAQGYTAWSEWQVTQGRRVLSRHDTEQQARKWVREHTPREWHNAVRHCM